MRPPHASAERLQKVLSQLGLASRREAEGWIRAGRLTVNGKPAELGMRVSAQDQIKLDGRVVRQRAGPSARASAAVFLCHRSPGAPLQRPRTADAEATTSVAERLPRSAGRRFVSISPMPLPDGGLELLTADGALAARLQRAVRTLPAEFSLRVRGELTEEQCQAILGGQLDRGLLQVQSLDAKGGEGSNRWYQLTALGASGNDVRQLIERQAVTLGRMLRTRLGGLALPRTLARGHFRALTDEELNALTQPPAADR